MTDNEPRELTPVQMFWDNKNGVRDFRPHVQKVEPVEEAKEGPTPEELAEIEAVEQALTPAPKDSLAQGSVPSEASAASIAPSELETPVQPPSTPPMPTTVSPQEDADSESGKPSESSADEPPTTTPPPPAPATSSPASSTATSRGKSTPPAVAKPPTSA